MKHFLTTTGLAAGIVVGGTLAASAGFVDLTDITPFPGTYTTQTAATASGSSDGVTWTITPSPGGALTYNGGGDAPGPVPPLDGDGDGIGVRGLGDADEVDASPDDRPREFLNLVFSESVKLTAVYYLDLFANRERQTLEKATLFSGLNAVAGNEIKETNASDVAILGTGFAAELGLSAIGTTFSFAPTGNNDGFTLDNFALAGFEFERTEVIPVPAAGFLLVGALGGLGLLRRRK